MKELYIVTSKILGSTILSEDLFYGTRDEVMAYLDVVTTETSGDAVSATLADDWVSYGVRP